MAVGSADGRGGSSTSMAEFKGRVMAATDIVDLIGRTVSLKKRGKDYVGLCPFHTEKSPSFSVNPARQFYFCYGCKAAGDAINFVKQRDRVDFMDALKSLAHDAGIAVPRFGRGGREEASESQVVLEANSMAALFFEKLLQEPGRGMAARDYLKSRGITAETAAKFRIGLAADAWDGLMSSPAAKKFTAEQLHRAGLVKKRDAEKGGGFYDAFRNRLIFPIRDANGRVIAFGGREMPGADNPPKYLNSPETPVFIKSRCIYGLDLARQRIVETQTAVVVEGYTDVVMAHQFGATNVVSPLGTALTEQHVGVLRRFAERIVLLFDPDTAGEAAVDRAVSLFLTQPVEIAIADLGEDLDPDEYLLKYGLERFEALIAAAPEALAYKWKQLVRKFAGGDGNNVTGQQKAVAAYLELIGQARHAGPVDPIRWGLVAAKIAKLTGISVEHIHRQLQAVRPAAKKPSETTMPAEPAVAMASAIEPRGKSGVLSARDRAERWILGALLLQPAKWHGVQAALEAADFTEIRRQRLAEVYWNYQRDEGEPVFSEFLGHLNDENGAGVSGAELKELAIEVSAEVEELAAGEADPDSTLNAAIAHLELNRQTQSRQNLVAELRRSGAQNLDEAQEVDLLQKLQDQIRQAAIKKRSAG